VVVETKSAIKRKVVMVRRHGRMSSWSDAVMVGCEKRSHGGEKVARPAKNEAKVVSIDFVLE
jgi:hypothetical protein